MLKDSREMPREFSPVLEVVLVLVLRDVYAYENRVLPESFDLST